MGQRIEIRVPDIGDFDEVEVVEVLVAKGDAVEFDDPLVSIESDKATMEIPSTAAGVVAEIQVAEGDRVSEGSVLVLLDSEADAEADNEPAAEAQEPEPEHAVAEVEEPRSSPQDADADAPSVETAKQSDRTPGTTPTADRESSPEADSSGRESPSASGRVLSAAAQRPVPDRTGLPHASPLVRRYARELGVPVESAEGSGPHGRILVEDLKQTVRERFASAGDASAVVGQAIPSIPVVDHAAFGPVREEPLTRIQKVSGPGLQRSWLNVPHVTQHDEADITELEAFRRARAADSGVKLSPLLFVMKAVVGVLQAFPKFRASLAPEGDRLVVKEYFHLGIAVDTDQGLVVPVIRDVDRKGVFELAEEIAETAARARDRKLRPDDMKGAVFTISSLGGIGGTAFSPIVNAPEVAILGLSKTRIQPHWQGPPPGVGEGSAAPSQGEPKPWEVGAEDAATGRFVPRQVLPFSLSYDHRVIDGAEAARFTTRLAGVLSNPLRLLL